MLLQEFFRDCENKNLLNLKRKHKQKFKNSIIRSKIHQLANNAFTKIQSDKPYHRTFAGGEYDALQFYFNLSWIRENIEEAKISLGLILDPSKIEFKNELGRYLVDICGKIGYGPNETDEIKKAFQVDFRNALSHNDYSYECENGVRYIIWYDNNNKEHRMSAFELAESLKKIKYLRTIIADIWENNFQV